MNDHLLKLSLASGTLDDLLVDGARQYKPIDDNRFFLPNSVAPVLSLKIALRILK